MSEELKGVLSYGGQRGPQGPTGPEGRGLNIKASQAECTKPGDAYFDDEGMMHILIELPDTWEVTAPIEGQQGPTGETGPTGEAGPNSVYVGTEEPTDPNIEIWLNPEGSPTPVIGPTGPTGPSGGLDGLPQAYGAYYVCRGEDGNVYYVTQNSCSVTYQSQYGTAPTGITKGIYKYYTAQELPTLIEAGQIFDYWTDNGVQVSTNDLCTKDTLLIAKWEGSAWVYTKDSNNNVIGAIATSDYTETTFDYDEYLEYVYPFRSTLQTIDLSATSINTLVSENMQLLYQKSREKFPNLTSFILPTNPTGGYLTITGEDYFRESGITSVNYQKFASIPKNCYVTTDLTSVIMGGTFTEIPDSCFFRCLDLNVADFRGATNLTTILPVSLENCESLSRVYLPASIQYIDYASFCIRDNTLHSHLTDIYFEGTTAQWGAITFNGDHSGTQHSYMDWNKGCGQITVHCSDGDVTVPANPL